MANVIFDTNVYGKIIEDEDSERLIELIIKDDRFVIHNFRIIRDELRRAPKLALEVYDRLVKTNMSPDTREIDNLAEEYHKEYKKMGGVRKITDIIKDFKIVAFASIKNCDLVFSDDEKTMKNPIAINSYKIVNLRKNIRTPTFFNYAGLKKSFLGY
jgi:hypothetical protein